MLTVPYNGTSNHNHNQKDLNNVLNQNINVKKTSKVRNIRYKYRKQFLLTTAAKIDQNQSMIAVINHQRAIWYKIRDHS